MHSGENKMTASLMSAACLKFHFHHISSSREFLTVITSCSPVLPPNAKILVLNLCNGVLEGQHLSPCKDAQEDKLGNYSL